MKQCHIFRLGSWERRMQIHQLLKSKGFNVGVRTVGAGYISLSQETSGIWVNSMSEVGSRRYMNLQACDYQAIALLPTAEAIYHYLISEANPNG